MLFSEIYGECLQFCNKKSNLLKINKILSHTSPKEKYYLGTGGAQL